MSDKKNKNNPPDKLLKKIWVYPFVVERATWFRPKKVMCCLCGAVVSDEVVHAKWHHRVGDEYDRWNSVFDGKYANGKIRVRLDYYGRVLDE